MQLSDGVGSCRAKGWDRVGWDCRTIWSLWMWWELLKNVEFSMNILKWICFLRKFCNRRFFLQLKSSSILNSFSSSLHPDWVEERSTILAFLPNCTECVLGTRGPVNHLPGWHILSHTRVWRHIIHVTFAWRASCHVYDVWACDMYVAYLSDSELTCSPKFSHELVLVQESHVETQNT